MRFLFLMAFLWAAQGLSSGIKPTDEIICLGKAWEDQTIRLETSTDSKHKKMKVSLFSQNEANKAYEANYIITFFHSLSGPDAKEKNFYINAHRDDGKDHYLQLVIDLANVTLAAELILTLPEHLNAERNRSEMRLSSCYVVPKGAPRIEAIPPSKTNSSCNIL